jgi:hypothetical protein
MNAARNAAMTNRDLICKDSKIAEPEAACKEKATRAHEWLAPNTALDHLANGQVPGNGEPAACQERSPFQEGDLRHESRISVVSESSVLIN